MVDFSGRMTIPREARPISKKVNAQQYSPMAVAARSTNTYGLLSGIKPNLNSIKHGSRGSFSSSSNSKFMSGTKVTGSGTDIPTNYGGFTSHMGAVSMFLSEIFGQKDQPRSQQDRRQAEQKDKEMYGNEWREGYEDGRNAYKRSHRLRASYGELSVELPDLRSAFGSLNRFMGSITNPFIADHPTQGIVNTR